MNTWGVELKPAIFLDRDDIAVGQQWKARIDDSLNEVTFLIPFLTPSFFTSTECRREVERFLERESKLDRDDLILAVYYIDAPVLNDESKRSADVLAEEFARRQYHDWRDLHRLRLFNHCAGERLVYRYVAGFPGVVYRGIDVGVVRRVPHVVL